MGLGSTALGSIPLSRCSLPLLLRPLSSRIGAGPAADADKPRDVVRSRSKPPKLGVAMMDSALGNSTTEPDLVEDAAANAAGDCPRDTARERT